MNQILEFLGSANVQKVAGIAGGPTLAEYGTGLPSSVRVALAIVGPVFAAFVHAVDAYRAKTPAA